MSKTYNNPILFLSILFPISFILVLLIMNLVNKVMIDVIFMAGLSIFILGGFLWIIEKGIYSRVFKNFKKYFKSISKLESYVENYDSEPIKHEQEKKNNNKSISFYMLTSGINLIIISTILAVI